MSYTTAVKKTKESGARDSLVNYVTITLLTGDLMDKCKEYPQPLTLNVKYLQHEKKHLHVIFTQ